MVQYITRSLFLVSFGLLSSWNTESAQSPHPTRGEGNHFFSEAFIYQYMDNLGEYQFIWLCFNPETDEILYIPKHDLLKAIISYPNGDYVGYLINEDGDKQIIHQHLTEVTEDFNLPADLHSLRNLPQDYILRRREYQHDESILSKGIEINHVKSGEKETVYVSTDFKINTYQLYGFNRLEGDMRLPFTLDYIGILSKNQLVTDVKKNPYQTAKLNAHTATVYHFDTAGYPTLNK
jgi:nitrogen fixation protein